MISVLLRRVRDAVHTDTFSTRQWHELRLVFDLIQAPLIELIRLVMSDVPGRETSLNLEQPKDEPDDQQLRLLSQILDVVNRQTYRMIRLREQVNDLADQVTIANRNLSRIQARLDIPDDDEWLVCRDHIKRKRERSQDAERAAMEAEHPSYPSSSTQHMDG